MGQKRSFSAKAGAVLGLIGYLALSGVAGFAQTAPPARQQSETLIYSLKGPDLFRAHCAVCHGFDGKGGGPMAAALKSSVPDLTLLARNNKGLFPVAQLRGMIEGREVLASHGSREMPIWGPIFHQVERDQDFGNVRVENLIKYLQSIQQKVER